MKWVAQMPQPAAAASKLSQTSRVRPVVAWARWNRLIATALAKKQTATASTTRRQSWSTVRQV